MIAPDTLLPAPAKICEVIDETPRIKTLVLEPAEPMPFRAGQFIQLTLPGVGEAPFTPSSSPADPARLAITIYKTGVVTERLHRCRPGEQLGLRGPFGKGYPVAECDGKHVLIVGGGCGLAPLRALILTLLDRLDRVRRVSIKYGAQSSAELLYRGQYDAWSAEAKVDVACTIDRAEPGWAGNVGVVTTLLRGLDIERANAVVFACGPEVMLKYATLTLLEEGFAAEQIYLSMNRRMSCGQGLCGRCNIGPHYLCREGPDMNYALIKDYPNVF